MSRLIAFFLLAALAGCAATPDTTTAGPTRSVLQVDRDMGGFYLERVTEMADIALADTHVEIRGTCASACTLYLGMENRTCIHPKARLGFHGPQAFKNGRMHRVPEPFRSEVVATIAQHYPPAFRAWYLKNAAPLSGRLVWLTGQEAIAMGARACA